MQTPAEHKSTCIPAKSTRHAWRNMILISNKAPWKQVPKVPGTHLDLSIDQSSESSYRLEQMMFEIGRGLVLHGEPDPWSSHHLQAISA
jgi:hypothetical protein